MRPAASPVPTNPGLPRWAIVHLRCRTQQTRQGILDSTEWAVAKRSMMIAVTLWLIRSTIVLRHSPRKAFVTGRSTEQIRKGAAGRSTV